MFLGNKNVKLLLIAEVEGFVCGVNAGLHGVFKHAGDHFTKGAFKFDTSVIGRIKGFICGTRGEHKLKVTFDSSCITGTVISTGPSLQLTNYGKYNHYKINMNLS